MPGSEEDLSVGIKSKNRPLAGLGQQRPLLATKTDAGNKNRCKEIKG